MTKLFILLTAWFWLSHPISSVGQPGKEKTALMPTIYQRCCEKIMKSGPCVFFLSDHNGKMRFRLMGIYTHDANLFFWLRLNNRSSLDYDVDSIRFSIAGTGRGGNGPPGFLPPGFLPPGFLPLGFLYPVYVYDSAVTVRGYHRASTIYVLPRVTLPPGRPLQIIVRERYGGRTLQIQAANSVLERARRV